MKHLQCVGNRDSLKTMCRHTNIQKASLEYSSNIIKWQCLIYLAFYLYVTINLDKSLVGFTMEWTKVFTQFVSRDESLVDVNILTSCFTIFLSLVVDVLLRHKVQIGFLLYLSDTMFIDFSTNYKPVETKEQICIYGLKRRLDLD